MALWRDRLAGRAAAAGPRRRGQQRAGPAAAARHRRQPGAGHQPPAPVRAGRRAPRSAWTPCRPRRRPALLVRLAGRPGLSPDDPAVAEITRLCGYLPLAIGMVARQLHHHPAWTAAGRAAELAAARGPAGADGDREPVGRRRVRPVVCRPDRRTSSGCSGGWGCTPAPTSTPTPPPPWTAPIWPPPAAAWRRCTTSTCSPSRPRAGTGCTT